MFPAARTPVNTLPLPSRHAYRSETGRADRRERMRKGAPEAARCLSVDTGERQMGDTECRSGDPRGRAPDARHRRLPTILSNVCVWNRLIRCRGDGAAADTKLTKTRRTRRPENHTAGLRGAARVSPKRHSPGTMVACVVGAARACCRLAMMPKDDRYDIWLSSSAARSPETTASCAMQTAKTEP